MVTRNDRALDAAVEADKPYFDMVEAVRFSHLTIEEQDEIIERAGPALLRDREYRVARSPLNLMRLHGRECGREQ